MEYLKEHSMLDVNIQEHEEKIHGLPKLKHGKSEMSEVSVKKFHFHIFNGSNRIVSIILLNNK